MIAGFTVVLALLAIILQSPVLTAILLLQFVLRTAFGPRAEPVSLFISSRLVSFLRIPDKPGAGAPRRFAQAIGLVFSLSALVLMLTHQTLAFQIVLGILAFCAALEAIVGFCVGCFVFRLLMNIGVVPESVCEECNNLNFTRPPSVS